MTNRIEDDPAYKQTIEYQQQEIMQRLIPAIREMHAELESAGLGWLVRGSKFLAWVQVELQERVDWIKWRVFR